MFALHCDVIDSLRVIGSNLRSQPVRQSVDFELAFVAYTAQESRAVARKPRDAKCCLPPLFHLRF